ncbi:MAG: hypothetical protein AAGB23_08165 [Pseudomonadota bacterium]
MEKPTFVSSGPDAMGRTVCFGDEYSRQARYGRIRPMPEKKSLIRRLTQIVRG